ncbi:MAG: hypothetical protein RIM99_19765 [Cyclobacteriaceae bacterium]
MDLQAHKKTLSIVHICYGALYSVIFLLIGGFFFAFFPFIQEEIILEEGRDAEWIVPLVGSVLKVILVVLFFFAALPSILGGIATLQNKKWGMVLLMIAGCLSIFSFPFGTAIGAYTIYVFIEDNKQKNVQNSE